MLGDRVPHFVDNVDTVYCKTAFELEVLGRAC